MHDIAWAIVRGRRGGGEGVLVDITRLRLYGKDMSPSERHRLMPGPCRRILGRHYHPA